MDQSVTFRKRVYTTSVFGGKHLFFKGEHPLFVGKHSFYKRDTIFNTFPNFLGGGGRNLLLERSFPIPK